MKIRFYPIVLVTKMFCGISLSWQTKIDVKPAAAANPRVARATYGCLPPEIELSTIVEMKTIKSRVGIRVVKETVEQRLNKLGARCRSGNLLDRAGRRIRFHQLQGC